MIKLGVLGSTRGTALQAVIDAISQKTLDAKIEFIISNKSDALILERAKAHNIPNQFVSAKNLSREDYDATISTLFKTHQVDLILLVGYMRILSKPFTDTWHHKILNVHPSLLPEFPGLMDLDVHQAVLDAKKIKTGCTIHFVDETVDGGEILIQKTCKVLPGDTAESLKARVQALENTAFVEAIDAYQDKIANHYRT